MTINKVQDVFELLDDRRMEHISDLDIEDQRAAIIHFALLTGYLGQMQELKKEWELSNGTKRGLRGVFHSMKSAAEASLEEFERLTQGEVPE